MPFADLRLAFDDPARLPRPWPYPIPGEDFLRGVGVITSRRLGGSPVWPGEDAYVRFGRLLQLDPVPGNQTIYVRCFGTTAGYRIDIGEVARRPSGNRLRGITEDVVIALQRPLRVKGRAARRLVDSNRLIAAELEERSQRHGTTVYGRVRPGELLVMVEDVVEGLAEATVSLDDIVVAHRSISVLRLCRPATQWGWADSDRRLVRQFRLAWWRAHTEIESLRAVHRAWRAGELANSAAVRDLLDELADGLSRWRRYGVRQIDAIAWRDAHDPTRLNELADLTEMLVAESKGLARKIGTVVDRARQQRDLSERIAAIPSGHPIRIAVFVEDSENIVIGDQGTINLLGAPSEAAERTSKIRLEVEPMDPVSLVIAALVAGAAAGFGKVASDVVTDAYSTLKSGLKRLFGTANDSEGAALVDAVSNEPQSDTKALRVKLDQIDVADKEDLIKAAQDVLAKADPAGHAAGKYTVTVSNSQGVVTGDHSTQTNTFGSITN